MSNDETENFCDDTLEVFTCELMKDITQQYRDHENATRLIEQSVAQRLLPWLPDKYTEVDIKAIMGLRYISVITEFMTDERTMMVVVHEEKIDNVDMWYAPAGYIHGLLPSPNNEIEPLPGSQGIGSVLGDMEYFRKKLYAATGISTKYLEEPKVAESNNLGIVHTPMNDYSHLSSIGDFNPPFDAKGTVGWSEECTNIPPRPYSVGFSSGYKTPTDVEGVFDLIPYTIRDFNINQIHAIFEEEVKSEVMKF